jgi:outer membrane protein
MKNIFRTILFLLVVSPISLFGQIKFGHINSNELLSKMPKVIEAKKKIEELGKSYEDQLKELRSEYDKKLAAYQAGQATWPEATRKSKETDLLQLQERMQSFNQTANEDIQKKQEEYLSPIVNKVKEAIKAIAKEGKYAYIFDSGVGSVLYAQESDDITPLVKKKLGLE